MLRRPSLFSNNPALELVLNNMQYILSDMHREKQQRPRLRRLPNKRTRGKRLGMVLDLAIYANIHLCHAANCTHLDPTFDFC